MDTMSIPSAALRDQDSVELMRVWIAEQGLHCSLKVGMYAKDGPDKEIAAWGIILADLTQHIADALNAEGLGSRAELFESLVDAFGQEVSEPTSARSGEWDTGTN